MSDVATADSADDALHERRHDHDWSDPHQLSAEATW